MSPLSTLSYLSLSFFVFSRFAFIVLSFDPIFLSFFFYLASPAATHHRDFIFYVADVPAKKVSWYTPAKFSRVQFARRSGRHRVKRAQCRLRSSETVEMILESNVRVSAMCAVARVVKLLALPRLKFTVVVVVGVFNLRAKYRGMLRKTISRPFIAIKVEETILEN